MITATPFDPTQVQQVITAFVQGWFIARGKGCSALQQQGNAWHVHYGVPMGGRDHEIFIYDVPIPKAVRLAWHWSRNAPHYLGILHELGDRIVAEVAAAGYALSVIETLMLRPALPLAPASLPEGMTLQQVTTIQQADWYNQLQKRTAIFPAELEDTRLRYYLVYQGMVPVARGRLVLLDEGIFCLDGIHTLATHRRRGIARAMVTQMIMDAAAAGHVIGVLSSSDMGYTLYQQLGYQNILQLTIFESTIAPLFYLG